MICVLCVVWDSVGSDGGSVTTNVGDEPEVGGAGVDGAGVTV